MPPPCLNHRQPTAGDTPTASAACSDVIPVAITRQNSRSTSLRCEGAPGDFIAERPVNAFIQPAGLPTNTSLIKVLRRPVEFTQFRSKKFVRVLKANSLVGSMGRVGACGDNAAMESFFSLLQKNVLDRQRWQTRDDLRHAIIVWIERTYNRRRRQRVLGKLTPVEYEAVNRVQQAA